MIYKINCSISGNNLNPEKILNKIQGDFIVKSYHNPESKKFQDKEDEYGYGSILFWHPKKFAIDDRIPEYEAAFVDFLELNYKMFLENGLEDVEMYIEIYYDGSQCNFEIFNKFLLKKLAKLGVSIPISVYELGEIEIQKWRNEIELEWV